MRAGPAARATKAGIVAAMPRATSAPKWRATIQASTTAPSWTSWRSAPVIAPMIEARARTATTAISRVKGTRYLMRKASPF
jgi:hypothetical protein